MKIKKNKKVEYISERKGNENKTAKYEGSLSPGIGQVRLGMSKGATVPTVAYGNAKIGVWIERLVKDDERAIEKNLSDMSEFLDDWINSEVKELEK